MSLEIMTKKQYSLLVNELEKDLKENKNNFWLSNTIRTKLKKIRRNTKVV